MLLSLLFLSFRVVSFAEDSTAIHIVPEPAEMSRTSGHFTLDENVSLEYKGKDTALLSTFSWFRNYIKKSTGYVLSQVTKSGGKAIVLKIDTKGNSTIGKEGYRLSVTAQAIQIKAQTPAGIFYGLQTLLQLLPAAIENDSVAHVAWMVPCVEITDYPRFGWRGLMLDVSRHFFTKEEVKSYIDEMAKYKFNVFHWHLTDDNGWRVEIKSLPLLTQKGAWRVARTGRWGTFQEPQPGEPTPYGGFYTQEEIREVIRYAQARNITILPEVDIPAHSLALITAYPNLSCTQQQYSVNPGSPFYKQDDNALCIGNDSVYLVLDKIFTELAALFPSPYIHIGGDEAYKGFWEKDLKCQALMKKEGLKNVEELQSYFVKRMEKMLLSKGKKLIGWDEILEGGLAPEATVMSWRGMQGGITAARMNHHVVMTPWDFTYLDLYQGEKLAEPATYGLCRLSDSYNYEPVPDSVDEKFILGGQGNLWTESVPTFRQAEYMTWPRALALSEVYWSPKEKRNWNLFTEKLETQFSRLDAADVKYARSVYNVIFKPLQQPDSSLAVDLSTEMAGLDIYYTFDYTNPDRHSARYDGRPISFPAGADQLNVVTYKKGKPVGAQINIKKEELNKRLAEKKHIY